MTADHFAGCHPADSEAPADLPNPSWLTDSPAAPEPEACWHCGTETTIGCRCPECMWNADNVPPTSVFHCPTCRRWWAYMMPRITRLF